MERKKKLTIQSRVIKKNEEKQLTFTLLLFCYFILFKCNQILFIDSSMLNFFEENFLLDLDGFFY